MSHEVRLVFILLRMRYYRLVDDPDVFDNVRDAEKAFEEYTRMSWDDARSLSEELGGDPDEIMGGPFAGTRIVTVEIPHSICKRRIA